MREWPRSAACLALIGRRLGLETFIVVEKPSELTVALEDAPEPGSLEHFLTERYCLYAEHEGVLYRADIHHRPWPLQPADARIDLNTMAPRGLRLEGEPGLHYSARQDVVIWPLERAG